jgi:hypothetical protein
MNRRLGIVFGSDQTGRASRPQHARTSLERLEARLSSLATWLICRFRRPVARRPDGRLRAVLHASLPQDCFDMNFDCGFGQSKLPRDQLIGRSLHQAAQYLALAPG